MKYRIRAIKNYNGYTVGPEYTGKYCIYNFDSSGKKHNQ